MLKKVSLKASLILLIALLMGTVCEGALRYNVNENLSLGVDQGVAITAFDFNSSELLGGYTIPAVLYNFPEDSGILKDYDISLELGVVSSGWFEGENDSLSIDGVAGFGTNAPKIVLQYALDKTVNKVIDKDIVIPDKAKIGLLYRLDTSELLDNGVLDGSVLMEFGWKF